MNILYVEDDARDADLTRRALQKAAPHFRLDTVATHAGALARLGPPPAAAYDLVLTDMRLPDGDGLAIVSHVRHHALPMAVVVVTGQGDEETAVAVLKAGADDYVVKRKGYLERLSLTLETALHRHRADAARRARPLRVLYAEHHASDIDLTRRHLARWAPQVHLEVVQSSAEVLRRLPGGGAPRRHDILLLDYKLPGQNALELVKELHGRGVDLPVVVVTGQGDEEVAMQTLRLGAADYVVKNPGYLHQLPSVLENTFHRTELTREQSALREEVAARRRAEEALRESEARYRTLVEEVPAISYTAALDDVGSTLYISPQIAPMLGFTPAEWLADPALWSRCIHADDRAWVLAEYGQAAAASGSFRCEYRLTARDGRVLWFRDVASLVRGGDGQPLFLQGVMQDITESKRAAEERERLRESLRRSEHMAAMGSLVGAVAHEVRNPLFGISATIDALESRFGRREEYREHLGHLRRELDRLSALMRDLLEYGRPHVTDVAPGKVEEIVAEAVASCAPLAAQANARISVDAAARDEALPLVGMDRDHLRRVFENLLQNAVQHSPPGSVVSVGLRSVRADDQPWVECTVDDGGPGFPADDLPHVFEPFFSRRHGGTGLGLAIVQRIVEEHRGTISAANRPAGGAVLTVRLPAA